jgi:hypothetical protein
MDTPERNVDLQSGLNAIDNLLDGENFMEARNKLATLRVLFGDDKELVAAAAAIDRWELLDNEEDQ